MPLLGLDRLGAAFVPFPMEKASGVGATEIVWKSRSAGSPFHELLTAQSDELTGVRRLGHVFFGARGAVGMTGPTLPVSKAAASNAALETGLDERVEATVQDRLGVANLDARAQILDAGLIEHVGANLAAPANV